MGNLGRHLANCHPSYDKSGDAVSNSALRTLVVVKKSQLQGKVNQQFETWNLSPSSRLTPHRIVAAVARKPGEPLVIEDIIVAPPMPHEVLIWIICTSICHSDITFWNMQDPHGFFPRILGHEAIGVVESVGKDITEVTKGDVVLPIFLPDCGECIDCKSTKSNRCTLGGSENESAMNYARFLIMFGAWFIIG